MTVCDEPAFCGSPGERHWVECELPDWFEDREGSDYRSEQEEEDASNYRDDQDEDPMDESDGDY